MCEMLVGNGYGAQLDILGVHAKREVLQVQVSRGALGLNQVSQFIGGGFFFDTMQMVILLLLFFGFALGGEGRL